VARAAAIAAFRLNMLAPIPSISDLLRYPGRPGTAVSLVWRSGGLQDVRADGEEFPIAAGQPVLIDFANSLCRKEWFAVARKNVSVIGERSKLPRTIKGILTGSRRASRDNILRFRALLPTRPVILMIGAGTMGAGCETLYEDRDVQQIAFDIYPSDLTQFVADTHQIPLADESVDGVIIQAVLEHVLEPAAVVAEIYRVLKPGGVVYAETSFMQQVHEGAYDFTRFTELGHRWLWRQFEEIHRGVIGGPGLSLYWSARYFWRAVLGRRRLADAISLPALAASLIDHLLPLERKIAGANGVFFLGRKVERPLPREELISRYLGSTF
jgi:SAM-dependent methyltransferase